MRVPGSVVLVALMIGPAGCAVSGDFSGTAFLCPDGRCPAGHACVDGACVAPGGPPADGPPGAADAAPDATLVYDLCGDDELRPGVEECDDGNRVDGDGCSSSCLRCDQGAEQVVDPATGHCYTRHDEPTPAAEAEAACAALGGHLVTYRSADEVAVVRPILAGVRSWIGLDDRDAEGVHAWVTGEPLDFLNWQPGEPNDSDAVEDCVEHFDSDGDWNDRDCGGAQGFVCEQDGWAIRPLDGHAYRTFHQPLSQPEAQAACAALGGHLVTIESAEEQALVAEVVDTQAWIGLGDAAVEGTYVWVTGDLADYTNWGGEEPNAFSSGDDCALIGVLGGDTWSDEPCSLARAYVCEIDD